MGTEAPTHVRWSTCGLLVSGDPCFGHEYSGLEFCAGSCSEWAGPGRSLVHGPDSWADMKRYAHVPQESIAGKVH